jgi:uncharacterized protein
MWPSRETATLTVFGGMLELPVRPPDAADSRLAPLPEPQTAPPEPTSAVRPGVVRIDRIGLELGSEGNFQCHAEPDDPHSAVAEMRFTQTVSRDTWRTRIGTWMQLSCTYDAFVLRAAVRAWDDDAEVWHREWDRTVPRGFV